MISTSPPIRITTRLSNSIWNRATFDPTVPVTLSSGDDFLQCWCFHIFIGDKTAGTHGFNKVCKS